VRPAAVFYPLGHPTLYAYELTVFWPDRHRPIRAAKLLGQILAASWFIWQIFDSSEKECESGENESHDSIN
jgi:hypothetical protein